MPPSRDGQGSGATAGLEPDTASPAWSRPLALVNDQFGPQKKSAMAGRSPKDLSYGHPPRRLSVGHFTTEVRPTVGIPLSNIANFDQKGGDSLPLKNCQDGPNPHEIRMPTGQFGLGASLLPNPPVTTFSVICIEVVMKIEFRGWPSLYPSSLLLDVDRVGMVPCATSPSLAACSPRLNPSPLRNPMASPPPP